MKNRARAGGLLVLVGVAMGCSAVDPGDETESTDRSDPIVGGQATTGFPAVGTFITASGKKRCTGTVIAKRTVLTAAHCLKPYASRPVKFMLGSSYASPTAIIGVAALKAHPSYSPNYNDIGIVTLASDAPVAPMRILPSFGPSWLNKPLLFVGFGQSDGTAHAGQGIKRVVSMPITSIRAMDFTYAVPGKNTCRGDSGGPAFAEVGGELFVAGITSYGDEDCVEYGVDMRADAYKGFIDSNSTGGTTPDDPCHGETYQGRCDGKQLVWCENQVVHSVQCSSQCGLDAQHGYYDCL